MAVTVTVELAFDDYDELAKSAKHKRYRVNIQTMEQRLAQRRARFCCPGKNVHCLLFMRTKYYKKWLSLPEWSG